MTAQKKSVGRRKHCSLDVLPAELRTIITLMLTDNKWPVDFGDHYGGTPRHCDIISYCKTKGYSISKSAFGRFALQTQTTSTRKIKSDLRPYVLIRLAEACEDYAGLQSDITQSQEHPEEMPWADEKERARLMLLAEQKILYIEQIIADLRRLK